MLLLKFFGFYIGLLVPLFLEIFLFEDSEDIAINNNDWKEEFLCS